MQQNILQRGHFWFLGGLSLHLNHLIAQQMAICDWPFGTLSFEFFSQIWTQDTLRHIIGPIIVNFEIFSENGCLQKIKDILLMVGQH